MKPEDRYAHTIPQKVFQHMRHFGRLLESNGYSESREKPNLFYRVTHEGYIYFADLRGTFWVPVTVDPTPRLYASFRELKPQSEEKQILEDERERLGFGKISLHQELNIKD